MGKRNIRRVHFIGWIRWNDIYEPDDYGADISTLERMVDEGMI